MHHVEWAELENTKELLKWLERGKEELKDVAIESGDSTTMTADQKNALMAMLSGRYKAANIVIDYIKNPEAHEDEKKQVEESTSVAAEYDNEEENEEKKEDES